MEEAETVHAIPQTICELASGVKRVSLMTKTCSNNGSVDCFTHYIPQQKKSDYCFPVVTVSLP